MHKQKSAYTLIELLLTLSVLAVIIAVLVPAYTSGLAYMNGKGAASKGGIIDSAKQMYLGDQGAAALTQWATVPGGMDPTTYQFSLVQNYLGPSYRIQTFSAFVANNPRGFSYSFGPTLSSPVRVYSAPTAVSNTTPTSGVSYWINTSQTQTSPSVKTYEYQAYARAGGSWSAVDANVPPVVYPNY
jgi:prepilin-type N-terminal cleavage/methylation domain-containing protein